jgi:hypothetical protein
VSTLGHQLKGATVSHILDHTRAAQLRLEKEVKAVNGRLEAIHEQKRRVIDIYASGDLSRDAYVEKNRELDGMVETLRARAKELADSTALLRKAEAIDAGIAHYCDVARMRFAKCGDFADKRQFLSDYVEKVVFVGDKVSLHGQVPIRHGQGDETETNMLAFCIESEITRRQRYLERMRTAQAVEYQQSVTLLQEQTVKSL